MNFPETYPIDFDGHIRKPPVPGRCRKLVIPILPGHSGHAHQCKKPNGFGPGGMLCKTHWNSELYQEKRSKAHYAHLHRKIKRCKTCGQEI
jgi:hypothetical protein